ncbi:MAG TPA: MarR family transcriptional regulator [Candidatus Saccharimonadales bacterium]|nr:MarR family transcriptional regulator [Candidatus Saccharimonadales bacterium]
MEKAAKARTTKFSQTLLYRLDRYVSKTVKAAESRLREVSGMSFSQFLVLMALVERGDLQQSSVADYVGVTPAVISKQVELLAGQGLLQLRPAHNDRRSNLVRITPSGRQSAQQALATVQEAFAASSAFPDHYKSKLQHWLDAQNL